MKSKIRELEEQYFIDTTELGKVLLVACVTMFFISVYASTTLATSQEQLEELEEEQRYLKGIIEGESFQTSYDAVHDVSQTEPQVGQQFEEALNAYEQMGDTVNRTENVSNEISEKQSLYQWVVLVSILGSISGIALIKI